MPKYFFVLCGPDGERHDDRYGTEFTEKADAVRYGQRIVRELVNAGGYDGPDWYLEITADTGPAIATLPFPKSSTLN